MSNSLWPHGLEPTSSSLHGILQARILEWVAISFSRGSSQPRGWTCISHIKGRFFTIWATRETQEKGKFFTQSVSSVAQLCLTLCNLIDCSTPGFPGHHQFQEFTQTPFESIESIESVMPSNHLILCRPLLLPPSVFPSIGLFSDESVLHMRWPKYWSFSFSISPSNEYSGLIYFRWTGWIPLQSKGLKNFLQNHNSKASILSCSVFFIMVQLSYLYITNGKTIALAIWTFVGKVMSLLPNTMSRFVIAFLPRSKRLNFMAALNIHNDFGVQEDKICHYFYFLHIY